MKHVAPEVIELEADATAHGVKLPEVFAACEIAPTTWWRWRKGGVEPRMPTFRKVRHELDRRIAAVPANDTMSQDRAA